MILTVCIYDSNFMINSHSKSLLRLIIMLSLIDIYFQLKLKKSRPCIYWYYNFYLKIHSLFINKGHIHYTCELPFLIFGLYMSILSINLFQCFLSETIWFFNLIIMYLPLIFFLPPSNQCCTISLFINWSVMPVN